ncbi:MAG TPA: glycosyltransferase [Patescibacteria group bacterium]|nr:glycosyltransferase [Patescibacteria group bacterium]
MKQPLAGLRVAIVHDWLLGGGAERVVAELHRMFPDAPVYTSYCTDEWRGRLDGKVITGYLQRVGFLRKYVPFLRAWWFSHLDLSGFDLVISSSGAEAKGVRVKKPALHINYCHAPTHYYWSRYNEYMQRPGFPTGFNWLARLGLKLLVGPMHRWDYRAAQRPDAIIANSTYTQTKIKEYYGRESIVIHPPIDTDRFAQIAQPVRHGFIVTGRQTPYKRIDLAVAACTQLGAPLTVVGKGPDHERLVKLAGPTVTFVTNASDEEVVQSLASAEAFLFPVLDDFGIAPVEAMAAGTPVLAYKAGGALDYVVTGETGLFFAEQTTESLIECIQSFKPSLFKPTLISQAAQQFSVEHFRKQLETELKTLVVSL